MTESAFKEWLKLRIPGHWQNLEMYASAGIPDVNVCNGGVEAWLELKSGDRGHPQIRPLQYAFGMRRAHFGGRCFVIYMFNGECMMVYRYPFDVIKEGKYVIPIARNICELVHKSEVSKLCGLLFK